MSLNFLFKNKTQSRFFSHYLPKLYFGFDVPMELHDVPELIFTKFAQICSYRKMHFHFHGLWSTCRCMIGELKMIIIIICQVHPWEFGI